MVDDSFSRLPKVRIIDCYKRPDTTSAAGAYGCFEEKSSGEIYDDLKFTNITARTVKEEKVFKNSIGNGHGSVADQAYFTYSLEDVPRAVTLQLCLPEYLSHLQQSLRRASADRGYFLSPAIAKDDSLAKETKKVMQDVFDFYEYAKDAGIPTEDARFPLPLATRTHIQTSGDAREVQHLHAMNKQGEVPEIVQYTVNDMARLGSKKAPGIFADRVKNYETLAWRPSSQLYSSRNEFINELNEQIKSREKLAEIGTVMIGYTNIIGDNKELVRRAIREKNETDLSVLKHEHFEFLAPMSLATFHQATRQRTWNQSVESIYDAAARREVVIPPSILNSSHAVSDEYFRINVSMLNHYEDLIERGIPRSEAVLYLPHSLEVTDMIHVDGWNAIHSIGKRRCVTAQWEIRTIADNMAYSIADVNPSIGAYAEPQGYVYGKCPEKKNCGLCEKKLKEYPDGVLPKKLPARSKFAVKV